MSNSALVIGGAGFLGSHVADVLSLQGLKVTLFDQVKSRYLRADQEMVLGDIRDAGLVKEVVKGKDYVLNFAGIAGLDDAKADPIMATEVNILGNLNVLEALRLCPPKRYVFASSYYVYSQSGSIYRVTKQSCELFIQEYAQVFGVPYTILRFGSLYGTRANEHNAVSRFLKDALTKRSITREGDGEEIREYINALDAAHATYETMIGSEYVNQHVVLTGHQQIKIRDLLAMVQEIMGKDIMINYTSTRPGDTDHYKITPYTFRPQMAQRYLRRNYLDLGQGMLEVLYELQEKVENPQSVHNLSSKSLPATRTP